MEENYHTKPFVQTRMYISCPVCAFTLMQAEIVKAGIIKCPHCHKRICVEIIDGKVTAIPLGKNE